MAKEVVVPVYARIALDIASRISKGELKENAKIYGRSTMSSEYGVSPETIRRAMKLLADMEVVEIHTSSGTKVISKSKAKDYINRFGQENHPRLMKKKLQDMIRQQSDLNEKILEMADMILSRNEHYVETNPFQNYYATVKANSPIIGKTLKELNFWQETRATIIALQRDNTIILSPGPYISFLENDILIYIGDLSSVDAVEQYL